MSGKNIFSGTVKNNIAKKINSRTSDEHQYDQDDFLYRRAGPWPQPSPVHPFGESPGVIHVPLRERLDWWLWVGSRYVLSLALAPVFYLKALWKPGLKPVSNEEFEGFFNNGMLSKFLSKRLDDIDREAFGSILDEQRDWYIVDYQAVEVVKPYDGIHVSPTKTLFYHENNRFHLRCIWVSATETLFDAEKSGEYPDGWELAKYFVMQGGALCATLVMHPTLHFPYDSINAIIKTSLPRQHILFQLLYPHTRFTLPLENAVLNYRSSLLQEKWWMTYAPYPGGPEGLRDLLVEGYKGMRDDLSYEPFSYPMTEPSYEGKYGEYLKAYYDVFYEFVSEILDGIEPGDFWIGKWADYCAQYVEQFPGSATIFDGDNLKRAVTTYLFVVTVAHSVDHDNYGKMDKRQIPLRLRQAPPTHETTMKPRKELVKAVDMMKYSMADSLFFSPTTVTKLIDATYNFRDQRRQEAVRTFKKRLRETEQDLIKRGAQYMPLNTIARSIQY